MFENVGGKIKIVSKVMVWIEIIFSVIGGLALLFNRYTQVAGLALLIAGPLVAWLSGLFLYGFGQLIENTDRMANQQPAAPAHRGRRSQAVEQRREKTLQTMDQLLAEGLITEQDYQQKLDQM